jgi:alginate O-acetyltransferase complex protein AlgI
MAFDSLSYGLFLAAVLLLLRLPFKRPGEILPGLFLLAGAVFYAFAGWLPLALFCLSIGVNYSISLRIAAAPGLDRKKRWLVLGVVFNLAYLFAFKYAGLFQQTWGSLGQWMGWWTPPAHLVTVLLPVGISFYTFESLSLLCDVYLGNYPPPPLADFALFVSFFPHLIAGPIMRGKNFLPQIAALRNGLPRPQWKRGVSFLALGLFKKAVLADWLAFYVDPVFHAPGRFGAERAWLAAYGFAFRIFFDFSGYSDMAEGSAACMGLRLAPNFLGPYGAASLSEFWRRWHISLSTWLRDYLYIPLGGNRRGVGRTYAALMLTMLLGGLWHGPSWTFVLWGAYHGCLLALERATGLARAPEHGASRWLRVAVTFHLVLLGWVLFRADSLSQAGDLLHQAFHWSAWGWDGADWTMLGALLACALFAVWEARWELGAWSGGRDDLDWPPLGVLVAACILFKLAFSGLGRPFIYFRF